jgi:choline dehydrogenase
MRLCHQIAQQEPINSLLDHASDRPDFDHRLHFKSDAELEEIVRERVETVYHPTSSCRMAPLDQGGVVDSELKVYGIDGLRVCDASIFPSIISGHTVRCFFSSSLELSFEVWFRLAPVLLRPRN